MFIPSCFALRNGSKVSSSDYDKTLCLWCVCVGHVPTTKDLTSLGLPNFWTNAFLQRLHGRFCTNPPILEPLDLSCGFCFGNIASTVLEYIGVWQALHSFYPSHALFKFVGLVVFFSPFSLLVKEQRGSLHHYHRVISGESWL